MTDRKIMCPRCGKDWVQKVGGLVASGVTTGTGTASVSGKIVEVQTRSQTQLSKDLSPPSPTVWYSKECLVGYGIVLSLGGIIMLSWLSQEAGRPNSLFREWGGGLCGFFWLLVVIGLALLILGVVLFAGSGSALPWSEASARDKNALQKWEQLFYCYTCDGVFVPGQMLLVPRGKIREYCYDEYPAEPEA